MAVVKRFHRRENPLARKLIRRMTLTIGGVPKARLWSRLWDNGGLSSEASDLVQLAAFGTLPKRTSIRLGWIRVRDLGFVEEPTTEQIFTRIREVGGARCPAEVGPRLLTADAGLKPGDGYAVMKMFTDDDGVPIFFYLERDDDGRRRLRVYSSCIGSRLDSPELWDLDLIVSFVLQKQRP